jgi:hypothetical protein
MFAVAVGIEKRKINWVIDADFRKFFDTIDRRWLQRFVAHRIGDQRLLRLIGKWLSYTTLGSTPRDSTFAVSANGQTREKRFTREEIEDSARTIESFAAIKVRMLVNNFTG